VDRLVELAAAVDEDGNEIELPAPAASGEAGNDGDEGEGGTSAAVADTKLEPTEVEE
jgi:hypothetical protein